MATGEDGGALDLYLAQVARTPLLDADGERALGLAARAGDRGARARLAEANLRLVVALARRHEGGGLELADRIQEGNIGLLRAVDRFDPGRGCRFSTHAVWWIREAITRAQRERGQAVRMPPGAHDELARVRRAGRDLRAAGEGPAGVEDLAAATGLRPARVRALLGAAQEPRSLSRAIDAGGLTLGDALPSPDGTDEEAADREVAAAVREAVGRLTPTQRLVLEIRYGLAGGQPRPAGQAATALGMSRQAASQAERRALRRLRGCAALREAAPRG